MKTRKFKYKGTDYEIEVFDLPNGKWGCAIYPANGGCVVIDEPHATKKHGKVVEFDTEDAALDYGEDYVKQDNL